MRETSFWIVAPLAGLLLSVAAAHAREPLRLIFISHSKDEAFFVPVRKGMQDAARAMNVRCEFTGTEGVDAKAQAELVHKAVVAGYDGIALTIIDAHVFDAVIAEAMGKGIPVVAFNVDAQSAPRSSGKTSGPARSVRLSAVCQDFPKAGRTLAEKALEFLPPGGKVLLTQHDHGIAALDERLEGIQAVLKSHGIAWKVLCTTNEPKRAVERIVAALKADPQIRCILGTGQTDTEAAGEALACEFPKQDYAAAGFDLSPRILELIRSGALRFTIDQQPYSQGYYPVVQLVLYCRYGIRPSDIDAGIGIVGPGDVARVLELSRGRYR